MEWRALRGSCMGAVNLYVTLPTGKSFWSTVFSDGAVAVHAIVALLLLGASVSALARAIRMRRAVVWTAAGLAGVLVAAGSGVSFVRDGSNGASLAMALAAAVALLCYLAAIFALGGRAESGAGAGR